MVATPKILRQRPQQDINKYNLYYVVDQNIGLCNISDKQMIVCENRAGLPGLQNADFGAITETVLNIGFDFYFNNKVYKQIHISPWGWLTLDHPDEIVTWSFSDFFIDPLVGFRNYEIKMDMTTQHVLLCPWFEFLRNYCNRKNDNDPDGSGTEAARTNAKIAIGDDVSITYSTSSDLLTIDYPQYNPSLSGVRYFRENNSFFGRRLIIRWNSIGNSGVKFEAVLYETGRIEFRYCPLNNLITWPGDDIPPSQASIGIFSSNAFRDFANELVNNTGILSGSVALEFGYYGAITSSSNYTRQQYERGGALFDNNFIDVTLDMSNGDFIAQNNYVISLTPQLNWPGRILNGAMFIFQPHTLKRKILPRKQINKINTNKLTQTNSLFDDRQTLQHTTTTVSYPSKLQRNFAGNTLKTQLFHDIFENDIVTTGSSVNSYDVFQNTQEIEDFTKQNNNSYNESALETNIDINQNFFLTGTNVDTTPGFDQKLTSKDKIVIELPIQYTTTLLQTASSMYYYDKNIKSLILCNKDATNPLILNRAQDDIDRCAAPEDYIGFSPIGTLISSGTYGGKLNTGSYNTNLQAQSSKYINTSLNEQSFKDALQATYGNSVCVNQNFNATSNQTFTLPITQPFLIEKAIIEVQIEADQGWCGDVTTYQQPFASNNQIISGTQFIDIAGPVVTCALFHQYNSLNLKQRDLILTSTFTTIHDKTSSYDLVYNVGDSRLQLSTYGLHAVANASAYITENSNLYTDPDPEIEPYYTCFSGSVTMFSKPQTASGCLATFRTIAYTSSSATNRTLLSSTLANPFVDLQNIAMSPNTSGTTVNMQCITNFGRSQCGFIENGQSIFGKELLSNVKIQKFDNIFLGANQEYDYWINEYGAVEKFITTFPVNLLKFTDNPYLIFPNQDLVFAISKTRSTIRGTTNDAYYFDIVPHTMKLISGSNIKITLFGSYIKENKEYHNVLKNIQDTNLYDTIDNEPVLDQFEIFSRKSSFNSYTDLFMTGSLLNGSERKKAFNICNATNDDNFEQTKNNSYSLTKQFEVAGVTNVVKLTTDNEIFYDSLIPDPQQCIKRNLAAGGNFMSFSGIPGVLLANWIFNAPYWTTDLSDNKWCWSYPFEPRYSNIKRLLSLPKHYASVASLGVKNSYFIDNIGCLIGGYAVYGVTSLYDVKAPSTNIPPSRTDSVKCIYGFGDLNTYIASGTNHPFYGTQIIDWGGMNNFATFRSSSLNQMTHPDIRGWKYGLYSGFSTYTSCVFRKNHYGHMRDMLEQRPLAAFYVSNSSKQNSINYGPITVQFINPMTGKITNPENTWSSNVDFHCTSSMPYFDGESKNRTEINVNNMNLTLNSLSYSDNNITFQ